MGRNVDWDSDWWNFLHKQVLNFDMKVQGKSAFINSYYSMYIRSEQNDFFFVFKFFDDTRLFS